MSEDVRDEAEVVGDKVEQQEQLLVGSDAWRLKRFLETHLATKPFLCVSSLGNHAPLDCCSNRRPLPVRYQQAAASVLNKPCVAGTIDTARGKWSDSMPQPLKTPTDPQIPEAAIKAGNVASKALNVAGKFALAAAVVIDSYRLGKAVYDDMKEQETLGKRTAKTSASVASGWAGGFAGAAAGNSAGAVIGGTIGAAFGGIGAIPGAAVGSLVGCLVGGVTGGVGASMAAENIVDLISKDDIKGEIFVIEGRHLCIKPSAQPESEEQDEEWLEIVKLVVTLAMLRKEVSIVTKQSITEVLSYEAMNCLENFKEYTLSGSTSQLDDQYYVSKISAKQDLIQELCATPQFFCSFLLMVIFTDFTKDHDICIENDLRELEYCELLTDRKVIPCVKNELLCMTDAGFALVWFNPHLGVEDTLEKLLKPHSPYLEVFDSKKII